MILDRLPFKRSPGRVPGKWGWMRYLHFGLSLALILSLWFAVGYQPSTDYSLEMMLWFLGGNVFYYSLAIGLAYALKDNRAFCKYACPVSVFLKLGSRFSLLKIGADSSQCNDCGACSKLCPMDIDIPWYILNDKRVTSTECILCETCVSTCARKALGFTLSLDGFNAEEYLQVR
jgi:polyferredoxin